MAPANYIMDATTDGNRARLESFDIDSELMRSLEDHEPLRSKKIPIPTMSSSSNNNNKQQPSHSRASSQGSSGSAFLSNILNPSGILLSHTPPAPSTSYEERSNHHTKRQRSGSVSARLRSASDYLEEKGLLDRHTKGILKDLIIIGDEELQNALDQYEQLGDPKLLEEMIETGALQNRMPQDLDILGDLDLDFLTMDENLLSQSKEDVAAQQLQALNQHQQIVSPLEDELGVGLDFMDYKQSAKPDSPSDTSHLSDYERRLRSNSLFSALLNEPKSSRSNSIADGHSAYGQWMDPQPAAPTKGIQIRKPKQRKNNAGGLAATLKAASERKKKPKKKKDATDEGDLVHVPGSGRPRSLSDPALEFSLDENGLQQVSRPDGWVGAYSPDSRLVRIQRFHTKRQHRVWTKSVKYDVRKNFADSRLRVKGRFVKKEEERLMRELMSLT